MRVNLLQIFTSFLSTYNKTYTPTEFSQRFEIFSDNYAFIENHNKQNNTFTLGINKFADLTASEYSSYLTLNAYGQTTTCGNFHSHSLTVPTSIDWRQKGVVTDIKDQGSCGSCWAFGTAAAVESAWAIAGNPLISLSEQQLMDCSSSYGNKGCSGGLIDATLGFIVDNGICSLSDYPYQMQDENTCKRCSVVAKISSCEDISSGNQLELKEAVSRQPVVVAVEANRRVFQFYTSGVLDSTLCGTLLDHAVVVVGYGEENGVKYWLVRNSWGTSWGDNGYLKILRSESTNDVGICGIASVPTIPVV